MTRHYRVALLALLITSLAPLFGCQSDKPAAETTTAPGAAAAPTGTTPAGTAGGAPVQAAPAGGTGLKAE